MKSQEDTVAVMVVYHPPESVLVAIDALLPQLKALVVVDNAANAALKRVLGDRVIWLSGERNNLAHAQNLGIAKARELGAEFVLLMDDDSQPAPDMVRKLRAAWREGVAVVAPYLQEPTGHPPHYIQAVGKLGFRRITFPSLQGAEGDAAIHNLFYVAASGSLIPLPVLEKFGGMDESLGLYFVDTEFCLRARRAGYDVVAVEGAKMQHRFGNVTTHRLLGRTITTTNHSAAARERMFRNRKVLWKRYLTSDFGYVMFDILRAVSEVLRVMLFEQEKQAKLKAVRRGLFSGDGAQ